MPRQPHPLVLASQSPRRAELLRRAGYEFEVRPPSIEEPDATRARVDPTLHAESLAYFKAADVSAVRPQATILGADTIAVIGNEIIGKAADEDHARRILERLSGTTHFVITGIALLHAATGHRQLHHEVSTVRMRPLSDEEISGYLATGNWIGKAGAYGIQDEGDPFVENISGSFSNIVGLPMERLERVFGAWTASSDA